MCLEFNQPERCVSLWSDITALHLLRETVSYPILLKCLVTSNEFEKSKQVLNWMEREDYKLKIHDSFITKLISNVDDIDDLKYIHSLIDKRIIKNHTKYIRTELILSYSKLGDINSATNVFNSVSNAKQDIVSVGAMMTAFIDNGFDKEAIELYDKIESFNNEIQKDNIVDNLAIKACGNLGNLDKGQSIYDTIIFNDDNIQIQNTLIDFFGDCGQIEQAMNVYNNMNEKNRDIVTIGALMKALVNNEADKDALKLYDDLINFKFTKTGVIYSLALKACTKMGDFERGKKIHDDIIDDNFKSNYITSSLIDFYGNFGDVESALTVYNHIDDKDKDIVAVNAMLTAYLNNNLYQDLVQLYDEIGKMDCKIKKNGITHNIALKACANLCDYDKGQEIHNQLQINAADIQIKNTLIGFYGNCSNITKAWNVFDCIGDDEKDIATMNAMMNAYSNNDFHEECVKLYKQMNDKDVISHNIALQSCGYSKNVDEALNIFNSIPDKDKDETTLNMMMQVYIHNDRGQDAINLYHLIGKDKYDHIQKNDMSHNLAIKAFTKLGQFEHGKSIIDCIDISNDNIVMKNRLIDFYAHFEDIDTSLDIFNGIPDSQKDISTINVMLNAYYINRMNAECLQLFRDVKKLSKYKHLTLDRTSYQNVLQACADDSSLEAGKQISEELKQLNTNWLNDPMIQTNLIHMYGKCGYLTKCDQLFEEIKQQQTHIFENEIIIWNAMIHAYGRNGNLDKVKQLFDRLRRETNLFPDRQTYIDILNTYGHCGESDIYEAKQVWINIDNIFAKYDCIVVTTLVDCLSRKNHLYHAYDVVIDYESKTEDVYYAMWLAVLSGCRKYENKLLAQRVYKDMSNRFNEKDNCMTHANVLMSHLGLFSSL